MKDSCVEHIPAPILFVHSEESNNTLYFPNDYLYLLQIKLNAANPSESFHKLNCITQTRTNVSELEVADTLIQIHITYVVGTLSVVG